MLSKIAFAAQFVAFVTVAFLLPVAAFGGLILACLSVPF